jgi:hypothetical protein
MENDQVDHEIRNVRIFDKVVRRNTKIQCRPLRFANDGCEKALFINGLVELD